jgi:hypothetical protein
VSVLCWGRGGIRFMGRNLMSRWCAVLRTLRCASRVSEGVGVVRDDLCLVRVCCFYGLGFGSDVAVVVRVDEYDH